MRSSADSPGPVRAAGRVHAGLVVALLIFAMLAGFTALQSVRAGFRPVYDEANYEAMVKTWLRTGVYGYDAPKTGRPDAIVTPGYPSFIAPFYAAWGPGRDGGPYAAIFVVHVALGLATIWGVWRIADRIAGPAAGTVAAIALALYPTVWRMPARLLTEPLSSAAFVLFLVVAFEAFDRTDLRFGAGAGALAVVAVMTRPSYGPMTLAVLAWLLWSATDRSRALRVAGVAAGVLAVSLALWVGWTTAALGRPVLLGERRGDPVLAGVDPYFRESPGGTYRYGPTYAHYVAEKQDVDMATYAAAAVRDGFSRDPLRYAAWFTIGKTEYIFFRARDAVGPSAPLFPYHYLFVVLGFAGLALATRVPGLRIVTLSFLAGWAPLMLLGPEARYGFGLLPLLAVAGAVLLARAWSRRTGDGPAGDATVPA